jgi:hypothetical protein
MQQARIVPLSRFFHIRLNESTAQQAFALTRTLANPGDYLILVGMHVATKEIPNWVWATFWWHDHPEAGPFAANRPDSVRDPWRNYLMNVSYDMNEPREFDGSPHVNFNPYLEAQMVGGTKSNCMTCHRLAASPLIPMSTKPGAISVSDTRFDDKIKLGFLWSLTNRNDPPLDPLDPACKPQ